MGNYYRNKKNSGYFRRTDFMAKQRSIEDIKYDRLMKKPYMRSRMDTLFEWIRESSSNASNQFSSSQISKAIYFENVRAEDKSNLSKYENKSTADNTNSILRSSSLNQSMDK